jgi:hypothetical protein
LSFPPGATAFIPSAVITHHNVKIQQGETRYSFTQYAIGSLFGYIENGMRSEWKVKENLKLMFAENVDCAQARHEHWEQGLVLFPHISNYVDVS